MMMTTILVAMQNSILVMNSSNEYVTHEVLKETNPQSIAFDPLNSGRAYCATFGNGLWKTDDDGLTWSNIGKDDISSPYVMSVAVSPLNSGNKFNKVIPVTAFCQPTCIIANADLPPVQTFDTDRPCQHQKNINRINLRNLCIAAPCGATKAARRIRTCAPQTIRA